MRYEKRRLDDDPILGIVVLLAKPVRIGDSGSIRNQRWGRSVESPRLDASAEVLQHTPGLSPTGVNDGQHSLDKPTSLRAVGATARLPQQHALSFGPFRLVVGRCHSVVRHESPEPL